MEEIIYFEINNWFAGRDYPYEDPFKQWVKDAKFEDVEWCKNNKLCVKYGNVDMSVSWCVGATRSWVMENCPNLLSDGEYTYDLIHCGSDGSEVRKSYPRKYSDFLCHCDEDGTYYSRIDGWKLPEYCEENFDAVHTDEYWTNLEMNSKKKMKSMMKRTSTRNLQERPPLPNLFMMTKNTMEKRTSTRNLLNLKNHLTISTLMRLYGREYESFSTFNKYTQKNNI